MAELVQFNIETLIHELVDLEKFGIFNSTEVKKILAKRKEYEYRIRKVNKNVDDFLLYITYEISILKLIRIRREKFNIEVCDYNKILFKLLLIVFVLGE